jgi:hypothetical protein
MTLRYVSGFRNHQMSTEKIQEILNVSRSLYHFIKKITRKGTSAGSVWYQIDPEWFYEHRNGLKKITLINLALCIA